MNHYIVTFDRSPDKNYAEFHKRFTTHTHFTSWWHYIKSCYIVATDLPSGDISDHFTACAKDAGLSTTHLVVRIDLSRREGRLITDAWEWIQKNAPRQSG